MLNDLLKKSINNSNVSSYQPTQDVIDLSKIIQRDYSEGINILNKGWTELNDRSVIEDENRGEMMFNAYVDTSFEDPNEAHEWRGTRSKARNKALATHAQMTANFLVPTFLAQNDDDEEDKFLSEAMADVIEWMIQPNNSNYQETFLQIVMSMITSPIVYMGAEFFEVFQMIKERAKNGKLVKKERLDEVLSGFDASIWGATEILRPNAYQRNIQKQRSIIKRKFVEFDDMQAKYGDHPNWSFVQMGVRSIYNDNDGLFYDVFDDEHTQLVAEETWLHRREDMEVPMVNGIYLGDVDVNDNPIKHRDNRGAPKYNVVPFGYYPIGKHFAFYKSQMNALGWDNQLIDATYETWMNGNFLDANPPVAISGADNIDSEVMFPKSVVTLEDKDARVQNLLPPRNNNALANGMAVIEQSMSEGSVNETISGQLPDASQKAFTVAQAQANSKTLLKGVGKSLGLSIAQIGDLMKDMAINNISSAEVDNILGDKLTMRYKTLTLDNKESGKQKIIKFDKTLIGKEMTPEELEEEELKELDKIAIKEKGKPLNRLKTSMKRINPVMFAKFNYLSKVDVEEMFKRSSEQNQVILMELKAQLAQDPFIEQEELTRELMYSVFKSKGEKFIKDQPNELPGGVELPGQGRGTQIGNQAKQKEISNVVNNI